MSRKATTRKLFPLEMRTALDVAGQSLRAMYSDTGDQSGDSRPSEGAPGGRAPGRDPRLGICPCRAAAIHGSCCSGISTGISPGIAALALVRVCRHRMTTSLLLLQKNEEAVLPGRAMAMMDVILETVAAVFQSTTIAIDTPVSGRVPNDRHYGYVTQTRCDGHLLLKKRRK